MLTRYNAASPLKFLVDGLRQSTLPPDFEFPPLHDNQVKVIDAAISRNGETDGARFVTINGGRRFGKSHLAVWRLLEGARRGERLWYAALTYQNVNDVWKELLLRTRNSSRMVSKAYKEIEFPNGGYLAVRSLAEPDSLRGKGLDGAIIDEAAFVDEYGFTAVIQPMLLERSGWTWWMSSPHGLNWFHDKYTYGLDPLHPEATSFHYTSYDNPRISRDELERLRLTVPERIWREEYMAEFLSDQGAVFRGISDVAKILPGSILPKPATRYVFGVDWGRESDFTAIAVMDADLKQMVALERINQVGWSHQRGKLRTMFDTWQPKVILAEANSIGGVNIEALQDEGLPVQPFMTTAQSKPPLIEGLALAIERKQILLLDDPVLKHELAAYELKRLPGGGYKFSAGGSNHDDTVIALALAWHAAQWYGGDLGFINDRR